jgi:hypothetical protein
LKVAEISVQYKTLEIEKLIANRMQVETSDPIF